MHKAVVRAEGVRWVVLKSIASHQLRHLHHLDGAWYDLWDAYGGMVLHHFSVLVLLLIYIQNNSFSIDCCCIVYRAVTSCSTGGLQSAVCLHGTFGDNCDMGALRGGLMGTYFLFGVPIYANCLGQFAGMAIQRAVMEDRMNKLKQPIDENEFMYCANILSPAGSDTLNCGEYILLELMRLKACTANQIESLKANFSRIDSHQTGFITMEELRQVGKVVAPKRSTVGRVRTMSIEFLDTFIANSPSIKLFHFSSTPSEVDADGLSMQDKKSSAEGSVDKYGDASSLSIKSTEALKDYSNSVKLNDRTMYDDYNDQLPISIAEEEDKSSHGH